jgi:hypothetical protein
MEFPGRMEKLIISEGYSDIREAHRRFCHS